MSIQSEINRLIQAKQSIIAAITAKGVTVPADSSLDDLTALVQAIETGSNPVLQSKTVTPTTSKQTVTPDSGYDGLSSVTVNAMASGAMSDITVSSSGVITSQIGTSGYLASGTKKTKSLTTQSAKTVTPTTSNQTAVASGRYTTGAVTVKGDSNLVAGNIKKGTSIFGVAGSYEGSGGSSGGGGVETCTVTIVDEDWMMPTAWHIICNVDYNNALEVYDMMLSDGDVIENVPCNSWMNLHENIPNVVIVESEDGSSFFDGDCNIYIGTSDTTITFH